MTEPNLATRFKNDLAPSLAAQLGIKNPFAVPKPLKVTLNIGIPHSDSSKKDVEVAQKELGQITGQTPHITTARSSIAGFKIRAGDPVGVAVTLRGAKMFDFLDKLCRIVLPQVKDFRGVSRQGFDGNGNYTLGLTEQIIFPEIDYAKVEKVRGLQITIVTSAKSDEHAFKLLELIGMPFERPDASN